MLWTREYFAELRRIGADDLLVTTYSTATAVRMGLFENGFHIYENHPAAKIRSATLASLTPLPLTEIDMVLKQQRNPLAASLRD
jgi:tRNA U34 5-methylaminomethyl-2-thiouridine-forming methyltransferase MnmC